MLGTRGTLRFRMEKGCSPASRGQGSPDLSQPGHPTPNPAAGCPASPGGSCRRSATSICSERKLGLLVTPPGSPASAWFLLGPVPVPQAWTEAGGAGDLAGTLLPPVAPAPSLPGSARGSCPQNPRPSVLNLQISFHNKAGDLESVINIQTKHQSLSGLPGEGRLIGSCRTPRASAFGSTAFSRIVFPRSPSGILLWPLAPCCLHSLLCRLPCRACVSCPWTRAVKGL